MDIKANPELNTPLIESQLNMLKAISENPTLREISATLPAVEGTDVSPSEHVIPTSCPVEKELGVALNSNLSRPR